MSGESRDRVADAVTGALADGGHVVAGGRVPPDLPPGAGYYRPTVITELEPSHSLLERELFGPVTAVVRARDEREALRLANATEYGLAASVFTRDLGRALTFGRALEAGMVFVNAATVEARSGRSWRRRPPVSPSQRGCCAPSLAPPTPTRSRPPGRACVSKSGEQLWRPPLRTRPGAGPGHGRRGRSPNRHVQGLALDVSARDTLLAMAYVTRRLNGRSVQAGPRFEGMTCPRRIR